MPLSTIAKEIDTKIRATSGEYIAIFQLSSGPIKWDKLSRDEYLNISAEKKIGVNYRAVVVLSEIYSSLLVERILYSPEEGCCNEIDEVYEIDLRDLADKFNLKKGEIRGLVVEEWLSPTEFVFSLKGKTFKTSTILTSGRVDIVEYEVE